MDSIDDCAGDVEHFGDVAKESCACAFAGYFLDRAAEVDVDEVGMGRFDDTRGLGHRFGVTAVDLDGYGTLGVIDC